MAVEVIDFGSFSLVYDSDADATVENDVKSGATTLYGIFVDNTGNSTEDEYLKIWDATAPTVASDEPDWVIFIPQGAKTYFPMHPGTGIPFATGLSFIGTVTAGNTASQTNPTANMTVTMLTAV